MKPTRSTRPIVLALLPLAALLLAAGLCLACGDGAAGAATAAPSYHCPMHPDYVKDGPGDCPICGMRLVPIEKAAAPAAAGHAGHAVPAAAAVPGLATVEVAEPALRLAGIQTAVAEQRTLSRSARTVGVVAADESRIRHVHTKISGWVEKLYVNSTGQAVRAGQPLLTLYSQELLATQEEYLRAREAAARFAGSELEEVRRGGEDLVTAARRRLELFDVPRSLIAQLDRTGKAQRTVTLLAPASGYVTGKEVFEGMEVRPGMDLLVLTDLSRVWVEADFYEYESRSLAPGRRVEIALPYDPAARLAGRISYVYPYLNPETRTVKVRIELPNPGLQLKPGMYVDVVPELGSTEGVVVPDSAVIDTGVRQVVFVQTWVQGKASFEPREVRVGSRADGQAVILSGVAAGESVAVRANFLLDSESRLRAAVVSMTGSHRHGGGAQ
jgi:Cu(I)/Ag(I) efflux system membrane fusion protein